MDDQLLRDALRTSTTLPAHGTPTSAADIRAMGTRRRRRRHEMTGLAAFACAVLLGAGWLGLPSGGAPHVLPVAAGGSSSEHGAVVAAIGLVGVVALAVLVAVRAWTSRRSAGAWLSGGAVLLALAVVTGLWAEHYSMLGQGRSLSAVVAVAILLPNLVALGAMAAMLARPTGSRIPMMIVAMVVAISGSVTYAFPNQNMRLWWDYGHSNWVFRLSALAMLVAAVLLVVGWAVRGGARLHPGAARRLSAMALLAVIAVASSLPWLYNVRQLFDDSPTPLLVAGQVVLLLIPGAFVALGPSRRSARRVIGAAAVSQLVVITAWGVAVASVRSAGYLVLAYPSVFVLVGALVLWTASLIALPRTASEPEEASFADD